MSKNAQQPFAQLNLNRTKVMPCVEALGIANLRCEPLPGNGGGYFLTGELNGEKLRLNVYEKADGTTTLGFASGYSREAFNTVATQIAEQCRYHEAQRFELSVSLSKQQLSDLEAYLQSEGAKMFAEEPLPTGVRRKWSGQTGDNLSIIAHSNGTVQFQGKHLHLASLVWDYLINVLSLETVIKQQLQTYKVNLSVQDVKSELETRIPAAHGFIHEVVRKLLSSALAMSKIRIELEEYSLVAFPALRAIEGVLDCELRKRFVISKVGELFVESVAGRFKMLDVQRAQLGDAQATLFEDVYTFYNMQRHRLFHLNGNLDVARTLQSIDDANAIVYDALSKINTFYQLLK